MHQCEKYIPSKTAKKGEVDVLVMMSAGRKVSVFLGILLLICSVIGIMVLLGRTNSSSSSNMNTATHHHTSYHPTRHKNPHYTRPSHSQKTAQVGPEEHSTIVESTTPVDKPVFKHGNESRRPPSEPTRHRPVLRHPAKVHQKSEIKVSELVPSGEPTAVTDKIQDSSANLGASQETISALNWNFRSSTTDLPPYLGTRRVIAGSKKKFTHPLDQFPSQEGAAGTFNKDQIIGQGGKLPSSNGGDSEEEGALNWDRGSQSSQAESMYDVSTEDFDETQFQDDHYITDTLEDASFSSLSNILGTRKIHRIFDLASSLYSSNGTDFKDFFRAVSETVAKGNQSEILSHLKDYYAKPEVANPNKNGIGGRNAFETSLSAFVFMSFGVFLLNQIHKFVGQGSGREASSGRHMAQTSETLDPVVQSGLNILFQPPDDHGNSSLVRQLTLSPEGEESGRKLHSSADDESSSSSASPGYVNNMFRGLLNLVNAYTKDNKTLECIWSLYCHDLDTTASQQGLYGIAARINSIGLRLIMEQIPAELTLDVLLRSLLGWDGLPCRRMFPNTLHYDGHPHVHDDGDSMVMRIVGKFTLFSGISCLNACLPQDAVNALKMSTST